MLVVVQTVGGKHWHAQEIERKFPSIEQVGRRLLARNGPIRRVAARERPGDTLGPLLTLAPARARPDDQIAML
ncbi:hypothetical protein ACVCAH_37220 [Micromonospora sp. LZ34]